MIKTCIHERRPPYVELPLRSQGNGSQKDNKSRPTFQACNELIEHSCSCPNLHLRRTLLPDVPKQAISKTVTIYSASEGDLCLLTYSLSRKQLTPLMFSQSGYSFFCG